MKVVTNTALVESRVKWGKRVAPFTLLFLVGGLYTNYRSFTEPDTYTLPTLVLLALGFTCAIISSNLVNNWVKEPRADQTLSQLLKKFGNDYLLFNYTSPVSHVLVAPNGVYVIVVKNHDGPVTINGRRVSRKFSFRRLMRFFADEGLGAPISEAEKQQRKLNDLFSKDLFEEELPLIKPLLLFVNKEVELTITDPAIPVLTSKEFKSYLRDDSKERTINSTQRKKLAEILDI